MTRGNGKFNLAFGSTFSCLIKRKNGETIPAVISTEVALSNFAIPYPFPYEQDRRVVIAVSYPRPLSHPNKGEKCAAEMEHEWTEG